MTGNVFLRDIEYDTNLVLCIGEPGTGVIGSKVVMIGGRDSGGRARRIFVDTDGTVFNHDTMLYDFLYNEVMLNLFRGGHERAIISAGLDSDEAMTQTCPRRIEMDISEYFTLTDSKDIFNFTIEQGAARREIHSINVSGYNLSIGDILKLTVWIFSPYQNKFVPLAIFRLGNATFDSVAQLRTFKTINETISYVTYPVSWQDPNYYVHGYVSMELEAGSDDKEFKIDVIIHHSRMD